MGKPRECTICKHYGKKTPDPESLEKSYLYDESGVAIGIQLCRSHAVQLFQQGQKKFLLSHYVILTDPQASDEPKFLELLQRTAKNNPDAIS